VTVPHDWPATTQWREFASPAHQNLTVSLHELAPDLKLPLRLSTTWLYDCFWKLLQIFLSLDLKQNTIALLKSSTRAAYSCSAPPVVPPYDSSKCVECPLGARCKNGTLEGLVKVNLAPKYARYTVVFVLSVGKV
jgi:hypothetical protein